MKKFLVIAFFACLATAVVAVDGEEAKKVVKKSCCASMTETQAGCPAKTVAAKTESKATLKVTEVGTAKVTVAKTVNAKTAKAAKGKSCCSGKSEKNAKSDDT